MSAKLLTTVGQVAILCNSGNVTVDLEIGILPGFRHLPLGFPLNVADYVIEFLPIKPQSFENHKGLILIWVCAVQP